MGAYYQATVNKTRYKTWDIGQGAKLMEHAYIGNTYVEKVMNLLYEKPSELRWVCDYFESTDGYTWEETSEDTLSKDENTTLIPHYYIINHTKNVYIDIAELIMLFDERNLMIHPLPILCNSNTSPQGGGDFHQEDSRRATWYGDTIETTYSKKLILPTTINVTKDVVFTEGE